MECHALSLLIPRYCAAAYDHRDLRTTPHSVAQLFGFVGRNNRTSNNLVGVTGFEPATSWSQTRRSTKLSYTPHARMNIMPRGNLHVKL